MQPLLPYVPEKYPPRGRIWPQFGDEVLEDTLSLGEGIRHSLQKKKDGMTQWHQDNLVHHGLAPKPDPADIPVPDDDAPDAPLPYNEPPPDPPQGPNRRYPQNKLPRAKGQSEPVFSSPGLPPGPPDSGRRPMESYYMGDPSEPRVELQGGLGKPPDAPGGGVGLRARESFRTTQPGAGGLPDVQFVVGGGGGPPPQPPGAGALLVPVNQDDVPMAMQASSQGPPRPPGGGGASIPHYGPNAHEFLPYAPGDMPGPASLPPRARATPYDAARKRLNGKQPSSMWDEFLASGSGMDDAPSAPGAIVPMEEQNTGVKRSKENEPPTKKKGKKKGKEEVVTAQSPPSLPPPPPGGAAVLRGAEEPASEPASGDAAYAPTSVPHYRQKEGSAAASGRRKPPPDGAVIDDLPSVPVKRKPGKPLEDDTPAALKPETSRPRAPAFEPDSEPNPLNPSSSSSSSSSSSRRLSVNGPKLANQSLW